METNILLSAPIRRHRVSGLKLRGHHAAATGRPPAAKPVASGGWPGAALGLAVVLLALGSAGAWAGDNEDLQALAGLSGTNYVTERNTLLQQHPTPYDVNSAAAYSWGAGLAAYILDAWQADPTDLTNWENPSSVVDEIGNTVSTAVVDPGANGQAFWIEQVWKTAPAAKAATDALTSLLRLPLGGTVPLWSAVYSNTPAGPPPGLPPAGDPLQPIAAHALASLAGQAFTPAPVLDALSDPVVTPTVRQAALSGLQLNGPPDATSVLLATEPFWSATLASLNGGYLALAAQTNSAGRSVVYAIAQDGTQPVETRMTAVSAFTAQPLSNDIVVLQEIQTNNVPAAMTNQISDALDFYNLLYTP